MECADVDECYYVSDNAWNTVYTVIKRDKKWFKDNIETLKEFHESLDAGVKPELSDKDTVENDDYEWSLLMQESKANSNEIKRLTIRNEHLKKEMIELSGDRTNHGGGGTLRKKVRTGIIDYKSIDELKCINLEDYRKESTEYWAVEYDKS